MEYPYARTKYVKCSCCGALVHNVKGENVYLNLPDDEPYPSDDGFGMCKNCGGDPNSDENDLSEAGLRKRMGFAQTVFYDSRIEILAEGLNEENRAKFEAMSYAKKVLLISKAIEEGIMF